MGKTTQRAHGEYQRYLAGCRCRACRGAWAEYKRTYNRRRFRVKPRSSYYCGARRAVAVRLTPLAAQILAAAEARTARQRSDVIEQLVRQHAAEVAFDEVA